MNMIPPEELCGYLPWELGCVINHKEGHKIIGVIQDEIYLISPYGDYGFGYLNEITPLVRPLDQLVKEITVPSYNDGKPFVPMVDLTRLIMAEIDKHKDVFGIKAFRRNIMVPGIEFRASYLFDYGIVYTFAYDSVFKRFSLRNESHSRQLSFTNQIELFQLLHRWHFDIYGWLEKGIAKPLKKGQ